MNDNKNLMFEELESVEELGAFYEFMDGVGKGLAAGAGVVAIIAVVTWSISDIPTETDVWRRTSRYNDVT